MNHQLFSSEERNQILRLQDEVQQALNHRDFYESCSSFGLDCFKLERIPKNYNNCFRITDKNELMEIKLKAHADKFIYKRRLAGVAVVCLSLAVGAAFLSNGKPNK